MTKPMTAQIRLLCLLSLSFMMSHIAFSQTSFTSRIDSLLQVQSQKPFNGVIIVSQKGNNLYTRTYGFADIDNKIPLQLTSQFVLASISKQITAVLVLREVDQGRLNLHEPIRKYLPHLKSNWANSVTVHQLLNHTSGIVGLDKPLAFRPGREFSYSPSFTYQLLGQIIENTSGKSYMLLAKELFSQCHMKNTTTPAAYKSGHLVSSYLVENGQLKKKNLKLSDLETSTPGAGIISTAEDLIIWNECLHTGKLLSADSYRRMITSSAIRKHPIWMK
jgi:CubicO group peptidase (beta-lactamase class C family)